MINYLLHSSLLLGTIYLFYWLLLRKETFYKLNRHFLIGSVILAMILPLISIPSWMSIKDDLFKQEAILVTEILPPPTTITTETSEEAKVSSDDVILSSRESVIPSAETKTGATSIFSQLNYTKLFWVLYLIGVCVFILTFLIQFIMIILTRSKLQFIQDEEYRIYEMETETPPFSFLKWIFINPTMYEFETYDQILNHEKIHVSQAHYLDKLIAELIVMALWFNPFAWLIRREITNNLEFLTDDTMLEKGTEKESYQMNLLKVSVPQHALSLTTNYNQSILKTRIIMMNSKKSSASSSWKYLFILPLFALSVVTLNAVNDRGEGFIADTLSTDVVEGSETLFDEEQKMTEKQQLVIKPKEGIDNSGQPAVKIEEEQSTDFIIQKDAEITSVNNTVEKTAASIFSEKFKNINPSKVKPGFWQASVEPKEVCFHLNNSVGRNQGSWTMNECFSKNEIENFNKNKQGVFNIDREAGTLILNGEFENGYGHGKFNFKANDDYSKFLRDLGVEEVDDKLLLQLFISNSSKSFIRKVHNENNSLDKQDLIQLAIFVNNESKYENLKVVFDIAGESLDFNLMIQLSIHGVDKKYANEILEISPDGYSVKELISCKIHGVDQELIVGLEDYGYTNLTLNELTSLKIHGVNMDEMKEIQKLGYDELTVQEMVNLKIHGVSKRYIEELISFGYDDLSPNMIKQFAIHNVDKKHIEGIRSLGFSDLSANEMVQTKIHGLNPSKVKEIESMGFDDLSFDDLMKFAIHNVNKSFVEGIRSQGYTDLGPSDFVNAKIHSITGRYIEDLKSTGVNGIDFPNIKRAKIHGVSGRYIEKVRSQGYEMPSLDDYIKHKIHH